MSGSAAGGLPSGERVAGIVAMLPLRLLSRAGWAVVDQGFVSLSNFGLNVLVAQLVGATEFGAFGIAFVIYLVALNVARGFATQPLAIRFSSRTAEELRRGSAEATGLALVIGVAGGALCLAAAAFFQGPLGESLAGLGISLPGLLVQDAWRFVLFTDRRGRQAMVNDLIAVVVLAVLAGVVVLLHAGSVFTVFLCWGAGASTAAVAGALQTGVVPAIDRALRWWREHLDISPRFMGSELANLAGSQLVTIVIGAIIGLAAAGSVRAAQVLLGPAYVMSVGIHLSLVPEASRLRDSIPRLRRMTVLSTLLLTAAGATWALIVIFLPDSIGHAVLRASWPGAKLIVLPIALVTVMPLATSGARIGLRALEEASPTLQIATLQSISILACGAIGGIVGGVVGAAWGMALATVLSGLVWWLQYAAVLRARAGRGFEEQAVPAEALGRGSRGGMDPGSESSAVDTEVST